MVTEAAVLAALEEVVDPEIPVISVVDMGMVAAVQVDATGSIKITMAPTFVGCPALEIIRRNICDRVAGITGATGIQVDFTFDPPWTSERITPQGRERLKLMGIAPPTPGAVTLLDEVPPCPYCGSLDTHLENLFGPTACRAIYYCDGCCQPFEGMKNV